MSRRILLADDSLTIQKVVELTFADTDFEVIAVSSGDDLLAKLPECNPDLVICDVIMPGRDGYDVCQEIKSNPDFLHVPVVLLTGTFEPFDQDRALAVGCSEIITKPFEAKRLVEAVEHLTSETGTSHQPTPDTAESEPFDDGRVTPPPPIEVPDQLDEVEASYDLEDTAVSPDSDTSEVAAEAVDEGLEFTKSGFSAMEAAGREQEERLPQAPAEGLEFEGGIEDAFEPVAGFSTEPSPFPDNDAEVQENADVTTDTPLAAPPINHEEMTVEPPPPDPFPTVDELVFEEPALSADEPVFEEPALSADESVFEEPARPPDHNTSKTTPINVAEILGDAETATPLRGESFIATASAKETDTSAADTQDIEVPPQPAADTPESPPATPGMTDEEVDRIARRLLELAGDRIDRVAWEVIPDMAEVVVRERLREIEAEAEREGS